MELENFSRKLLNLYSGNPSKEPTPYQAKRIMTQNSFIIGLSELTGIEKLDELEKAFIKKGKPLTCNAENFIESLEEFKKNDEEALLKIKCFDEKCVRKKTGKIITRRLTKLFNNSIIQ